MMSGWLSSNLAGLWRDEVVVVVYPGIGWLCNSPEIGVE